MTQARLAEVDLPDFGMPEAMPEIPAAIYRDRLERLRARADEQGYDHLVVYADREHSANLAYLTGFDPRFEEAMLVVGTSGEPAILVGNECQGTAEAAPLPLRRHLFQDFSLPGQPRDRSESLSEILGAEGLRDAGRVGVIGWKEYADREHSANLAYLTGFDPRFEEAMLVVGTSGEPAILVGNECHGMAGAAPVAMRRHLFQDFSLPSQPRERSSPLTEILAAEGIRDGSRVGVIGWKVYADRRTIEAPAFIVDELRRMTPAGVVENAVHLLIDAADGLRVLNEVEQLAAFEYSACQTSCEFLFHDPSSES